ncbi:hypothetical protein HJC23_013444 [Cyclotella cryptica]|uniref:Uncharacterized protein n=1 Tax=Cyclotella cryptica TaxID=29204 RepID=A0ABD3NZM2_9STRA|eukprot:CCRYP_018480-RA/>CCRYP_018480-RA protein AED:0.29 eAED:0.29 QI:0/-1/0/1/-1/1/1/0/184
MAHTFSSVRDFLDHQQHLPDVDASDIASTNAVEHGDCILTVRISESHQKDEIVDTSKFAPQDIEKLRAEDPFLYYSIQNNRRKRFCCDFDEDVFAPDNADVFAQGVSAQIDVGDRSAEGGISIGSTSSAGEPILSPVAFRRTSMPNLVASSSNPKQARRHSIIATTNTVKRQRRLHGSASMLDV